MTADGGYALVICEKPDAARRVSEALSEAASAPSPADGHSVFRFRRGGEQYVVCSALGHLFGLSDPFDERSVFPIFDIEWYSLSLVDKKSREASRRISSISRLSKGASRFINACDFDAEGETIGFNVLRYASEGSKLPTFRAKFSTLTKPDLVRAFEEAKQVPGDHLARAGRARHVLDFMWGVNFSRTLTKAGTGAGPYRGLSVGRVQGPTLGFLAARERDIRAFVPVPYWKVEGWFERNGEVISVPYAVDKIGTKSEAEEIIMECAPGRVATVGSVGEHETVVHPVPAFNIGDLQKEAFRVFGFSPSLTLQLAEKLYLGTAISYPRTGSHRLPPSIGYARIFRGLATIPEYSGPSRELVRGNLRPAQGFVADPAHPAIYPTGDKPKAGSSRNEKSLFDLIVRRFLAAFGKPAKRVSITATISVGSRKFLLSGSMILDPGWMNYYSAYARRESPMTRLEEGERLRVVSVTSRDSLEQGPRRYSQGSLLEKMEKENIGTKATRAGIISTLISRGYVQESTMEVTELGLQIIEALESYAPTLISTELTRDTEGMLVRIEAGELDGKEILRRNVRTIVSQLLTMKSNEIHVRNALGTTVAKGAPGLVLLGACPVCKTGQLRVIRSKKTGKRFAGCSNYPKGCKASGPLPQRGSIRLAARPCNDCAWPMAYATVRRRSWKFCANPDCPSRRRRSN